MPQSLANNLLHIAFSTKNRKPFLKPGIQPQVNAYLAAVARKLESPAIRVESLTDHVHMVVSLSRKIAMSDLIEKIKTNSSRWIKKNGADYSDFQWQRGYGAFSVSTSVLNKVLNYLDKQQSHHRTISFQEEYRLFLKVNKIAYDERYVWD